MNYLDFKHNNNQDTRLIIYSGLIWLNLYYFTSSNLKNKQTMRKLMLIAAFAIIGFATSFAQPGGGQRLSPEDRLKRDLDVLTKELSLTPEQVTKVTPILKETQDKISESFQKMRESGNMDRDQMNAERAKLNATQDQKLTAILTADQVKKLVDLRKKQEDERKQRMQGGGGPR